MHHIDLSAQEEGVQKFFLTLPVDPEGTVVEMNGRKLARLVPIVAETNGNHASAWTNEKSARRTFLIDREIDGTLTAEEAGELAILQRQMRAHVQSVAPRPLEGARRLHQELLAQAEAARKA